MTNSLTLYVDCDEHGQRFHSKHFPFLKYFITTGVDAHMGFLNYKQFFLYNDNTGRSAEVSAKTTDNTPLYQRILPGKYFNYFLNLVFLCIESL